jgi:hypothetical protein
MDFTVGQCVYTWVQGVRERVVILDIREPNAVANWTCADQSKRCYKVRPAGQLYSTRKYLVRQGRQLFVEPA